MPVVVCPFCRKKLRPPDHLAGRRVTWPKCNEAVQVPVQPAPLEEIVGDALAPEVPHEDPPLPLSARLGILAMILGAVSVLILCLPFIGYASIVLSGAGVLMGLVGLVSAWMSNDDVIVSTSMGGAGARPRFGQRARDYPLAAIGMCLLALALALFPLLVQ